MCFFLKEFSKVKPKIRQANIKDIEDILWIEEKAWGKEGAATREMFESRIKTFPEGIWVAEINKKIVGVVVVERVNYDLKKNSFSWYEITDNGFIKNSHRSDGNVIYGVDLSVDPFFQRLGIGTKLLEVIARLTINKNIKYGVLGGRIPGYHKYADKMSAEEYVSAVITEKGESMPLDSEIRFYKKAGLKIVKVIHNYFKDPESLDNGILLIWKNPFYNKWYHWLAAKIFRA